ncbi:MAG: alpha/beta fold hydrolase [Solirubrobacteraceae bacterium]|nr:alpha/beta fold hydrolase [Solirubrobacteraceae bacterium]
MPQVETRSGAIAYREQGSGPPVVLLPSGAHTMRDFDPIAPALAGYRTIAIDWPGHGASGPPADGAASPTGFADAAEDVVAELAPEGAVVLGNSVGGFSAARMAIRRPELVRALVLVDTGGFLPRSLQVRAFCAVMGRPALLRRIYPQFATRYMRAQRAEDRHILEATLADMRDPTLVQTVASLWRGFAGPEHDLRADIGRITAPTLVVWGTKDPVIPVKVGREIAAQLPDARMLEFPTGHVPFASAPEAFGTALRGFLTEVLAEAPARDAVSL